MLGQLGFIDPQIAVNIKELQNEMRGLIQRKVEIQHNNRIDQKAREQLLRYNEQQRLRLRKIIEKCKMQMVEYLDKQVEIVSKQCVMNGTFIAQAGDIKNKQYSIESMRSLSTHKNNMELMMDMSKQKSISTNTHLTQEQKSHLTQKSRQNQTQDSISIFETNRNSKSTKSTNNNQRNSRCFWRSSSREKSCSQFINSSLVEPYSQIVQIKEFSLTRNNIPLNYKQQQLHQLQISKQSHNLIPKTRLSNYLKHQIYKHSNPNNKNVRQIQNEELQTSLREQLYQKKISCLQQKCQQLQLNNQELTQLVEYQQKVIEEMAQLVQEKQQQLQQNQLSIQDREINSLRKMQTLDYVVSYLVATVENTKISIDPSIYSLLNQIPQCISTMPQAIRLNKLNSKHSNIYDSTCNFSFLFQQLPQESGHCIKVQKQNSQVLQLSRQLVELQQMLKNIQQQNEELKGERKLLLKRVRIAR